MTAIPELASASEIEAAFRLVILGIPDLMFTSHYRESDSTTGVLVAYVLSLEAIASTISYTFR